MIFISTLVHIIVLFPHLERCGLPWKLTLGRHKWAPPSYPHPTLVGWVAIRVWNCQSSRHCNNQGIRRISTGNKPNPVFCFIYLPLFLLLSLSLPPPLPPPSLYPSPALPPCLPASLPPSPLSPFLLLL